MKISLCLCVGDSVQFGSGATVMSHGGEKIFPNELGIYMANSWITNYYTTKSTAIPKSFVMCNLGPNAVEPL